MEYVFKNDGIRKFNEAVFDVIHEESKPHALEFNIAFDKWKAGSWKPAGRTHDRPIGIDFNDLSCAMSLFYLLATGALGMPSPPNITRILTKIISRDPPHGWLEHAGITRGEAESIASASIRTEYVHGDPLTAGLIFDEFCDGALKHIKLRETPPAGRA